MILQSSGFCENHLFALARCMLSFRKVIDYLPPSSGEIHDSLDVFMTKIGPHSFRFTLVLLITACTLSISTFGNTESKSTKVRNEKSDFSSNAQHNVQMPVTVINASVCGPPSYDCSYDGIDPKPLCTNCTLPPVPDMSTEPNAVSYDGIFGMTGKGNQIIRCTYPGMNGNNNAYGIGFGGSGDSNPIGKGGGSPLSYRLIIGDMRGWAFPFTYTPDPNHPTCRPTYTPMSSFTVTEGSFSWLTPHLYYAFGGYRYTINSIDLGSATPPSRTPIADFQYILPRDGSDWPGSNQTVGLGAIIRPLTNNPGKFLFQSTCPPRQTSCSVSQTGRTTPNFSQTVMTDTSDGGVTWRNIGVGFNNAATWSAIGGVSKDDDVFVKGFSDEGGQGRGGAIFVAAYKRRSNVYYLYNVGTGIISYFTCRGGTGYSCSGGSWISTVIGMTSLPDRYLLHNIKVSKNGRRVVLVQDSCRFDTCSMIPGGPGLYFWELSTTNAAVTKITTHPWGHWTEGFDLFVNQNGETGVNLNGRPFDNPEKQFSLNIFSFSMSKTEAMSVHPSWNHNDGTDTTPICSATASFNWPYLNAWENEVICYGTNHNENCSTSGHGICKDKVKRFFHTYNPATCNLDLNFNGCWGIGALSGDGKYYAFTSNWGNTLGSTTNGGHGPSRCIGGFNFQINHNYKVGDVFEPVNKAEHPNSRFNVFKVTVAGSSPSYPDGAWPKAWFPKQNETQGYYANGEIILPIMLPNNPCNHRFQVASGGGGANGSKPPVWKDVYRYHGSCSSVKTGAKVTDGGVTWIDVGEYVLGTMHLANIGRDDCRSDVFVGVLN